MLQITTSYWEQTANRYGIFNQVALYLHDILQIFGCIKQLLHSKIATLEFISYLCVDREPTV